MDAVKNYINFAAICIIAVLSIYHLFIYLGRSRFKTEFYNLLFALTGFSAVLHISSVNYFPDGSVTICLVRLFVFLALLFSVLTFMSLISFPPLAVTIFKVCLGVRFLMVIILTPITLIMGRPWYFKHVYYPATLIVVAAGMIITFTAMTYFIRLSLWNKNVINIISIALLIYGLNGIISGICHFIPLFSFFKYNYLFTGLFYIVLAIGITSKFNLEFKELKQLKENLEKEVALRTNELKQEKENKTRFFINFAHETKTPLTLIKNYLDAFVEKKKLFKDQDIRIIRDNILKLEIDMLNFLDSEKIERGEMVYRHEQIFDLSALLADKLKLFHPVFKKKSLALLSKIEKAVYLKADSHAIDRVFNNLLDNAVKYSPPHAEISVTLKQEKNRTNINITDNGPGIAESEQLNIFMPYYQLKREKSNCQGMGLYIVKKIVDSLNGEIKVKSSPGKGTSIELNLMVYDLKKTDAVATYVAEQPLDLAVLNLEQEKFDPACKNILLVENELNLINIMYYALKEDYNIYYALHGRDALEKLNQLRIDLIVSDIMMDVMDGYTLIQKIPAHLRHIPFLFVTAKSTEKDRLKGLAYGAVDYIYKPFTIAELKLRVKNQLQTKNNAEQLLLDDLMHNISIYDQLSPVEVFEDLCLEFGLTATEKKIVLWLKQGKENKELARLLHVSISTINTHINSIYQKAQVKTRLELFKKMRFFV